ncbi:MAG: hypothetical protein IPP97_03765 [Candidatus Obscuribacter sp.]|jgi:hypothetical protein|nr:hypothetical protein [Candidatus Obscuribacter sp.]MDQ5964117.1 hypothetical protein [Cyanobacteriota bacterium erpe_2018_sw_39hr_WHONDRS-SW48-000098_B_bin.30]MBK7839153.1 hypothetical protein [Candidatus Obscuribacter sp.]MBK9203236.1 hypothetical protein [Candidatus Obscuribacter sp.]MBK9619343.1 hypothetical protein [Candidatus Obscuribacter sp.]
MDTSLLIPHYQALPFPAPLWLLQTLLVLGFFLHAIPMNFMLGGAILAAVFLLKGVKDKNSYEYRIGRGLVKGLPIYTSVAITQGIVPLLFVQLIYGPMFYTSSVLMAVPWFAIIFVLLIAYFMVYWVVYKCVPAPSEGDAAFAKAKSGPLILSLTVLLLLFIGYMFSNNMTLMLHPETWMQLYQHSSNGLNLNTQDGQLTPRYLHMVVGALAVAGLLVGMYGLYQQKRDTDYSTWLIKRGSAIYSFYTLLQIPVGIWFLYSLGPEKMQKFVGGDMLATGVFILSMVLMVVSLLGTLIAAVKGSAAAYKLGMAGGILCVLAMIVNRHQLRHMYVSPFIQPESVVVNTQWDLLIVFVLSAVLLIGYLAWLTKTILGAYKPEQKLVAEAQS